MSAAAAAALRIKIISDASQAGAGFDKASGAASKFAKVAKGAGGALLVAGGAAKVAYDHLITPAGDLEQSIGAVDSVFKGNADTVHTWAKGAAKDVGLARNEYNELATILGSQLKNGGTAIDELGGKTNELIGVGSDLSAMFGGTTADAVGALSSALKGERDPIERYGVSLNQAKIDAEAAALGFKKVGGSLSDEANQAATLSLIMKQTKDAHGAFARESDTLAHKQQVFAAQVENVKARLGTALLPVATKVFGFLADTAVPAVENVISVLGRLTDGGGGGDLAAKLGLDRFKPVLDAIRAGFTTFGPMLVNAFQSVAPTILEVLNALVSLGTAVAQRLIPVIKWLAPIFQQVFNNLVNIVKPVLSFIAALIRTVTAVIRGDWGAAWNGIKDMFRAVWDFIKALVTNAVGTVKTVLSAAWTVIKAAAGAAWTAIKSLISGAWSGIKSLVSGNVERVKALVRSGWNTARTLTSSAWTAIKSAISRAVDAIKSAVTTRINSVVTTFRNLPRTILRAVSGFGSLLRNAGRNLLGGLISGITSRISEVKSSLTGLTSKIPSWKGPLQKDKRLLEPAGAAIMGGLIRSIEASVPDLKRTLTGVTRTIGGTDVGALTVSAPRTGSRRVAGAGAGIGGTVVNITINGAVDPVSTGRQVRDLIATHATVTGVPAW